MTDEKIYILILEDSLTQAVEIQYIVESAGFDSEVVINGKKALEFLNNPQNKKPDVIISDVVMPEMTGTEFCNIIKNDEKYKNIPVILLTSLSDPKDVISGLECGADNFITKPYQKEYLINKINYIISNKTLRKNQTSDDEIKILFLGKEYQIKSNKVQILDLLFSSFENSVLKNTELNTTIQKLNSTQKELQATNKKFEELATHDVLTGIYNRRAFEGIAKKYLSFADRKKQTCAILHLDIDNFKSINDTLGHEAGDIVIKSVVSKLTKNLRNEDIIGRIGGDEFAIIIIDIDIATIHTVTQKIIDSFEEAILIKNKKLFTSISLGVSFSNPKSMKNYADILQEADLAMYEAKKSGKSQYRIFNEEIKANYEKYQTFEDELNNGIRNNEFKMVYQPIVDFVNKNIVGVESLIRWHNKKLGEVSPAEFIPFSETTKQIHKIGNWVIEEVMRQYSVWNEHSPINSFITINISPVQFERKNFISDLINSIKKYKINPKNIVIEITETAFSQFLKAEFLMNMKNHDILMAIDDFGSGYSSMQRLLELPIDFMKIDGVHVKRLSTDKKYEDIIINILGIAKSLNIKTIAECVETEEQAEFLLKNGCEYVQGYLYHKPMQPDEVSKLLK